MAIGTDQGGSVRIPAAYSGIYGMKPTHGLIPYTGIMPIEMTLDHAGIMTANVADNALLLDAIAGSDGLIRVSRACRPRAAPIAMPRPTAGRPAHRHRPGELRLAQQRARGR